MKFVGKGKKILISNSTISTEAPQSDFNNYSDEKIKRSSMLGKCCRKKVFFKEIPLYSSHRISYWQRKNDQLPN